MFRVFRLFVTVSMMGMFWLMGTVGGVFLGALLVSRGGQDYWRRVERFGRNVVDLAKEEFQPGSAPVGDNLQGAEHAEEFVKVGV